MTTPNEFTRLACCLCDSWQDLCTRVSRTYCLNCILATQIYCIQKHDIAIGQFRVFGAHISIHNPNDTSARMLMDYTGIKYRHVNNS